MSVISLCGVHGNLLRNRSLCGSQRHCPQWIGCSFHPCSHSPLSFTPSVIWLDRILASRCPLFHPESKLDAFIREVRNRNISRCCICYYARLAHKIRSIAALSIRKYPCPQTMQRILLSLSLLASAAVGVLASDDLKIDVTLPVECERKTQKGDKIDVHYRGTLQSNGQKFDASQ